MVCDEEPDEAIWRKMESTPGYAVLLESEFRVEGFREPFRLAFMPSKQQELENALQENRFRYMAHYTGWVKNSIGKFENIREKMSAIFNPCEISDISMQYLPPMGCITPPPVAVVIFALDARGYEPIVLDMSTLDVFGEESWTLLLAHEFHHYYRNQLVMQNTANPNPVEAEVFWALNQLHLEGVADQINMPYLLENEPSDATLGKLKEKYEMLLEEAPAQLAKFDTIILSIASGDQVEPSELKREIRGALPMAGHPAGYHMANVIKNVFGKERLIAHVADPFAFLDDYQKALENQKKVPGHHFSKDSIEWVQKLRWKMANANKEF